MSRIVYACLILAVLAVPAIAEAGVLLLGTSTPVRVTAPSDVGGAELERYKISLQADAGEVIRGISLIFQGGLHQVQIGGAFGSVIRTPSIDALSGFPAQYVAVDTHALISSTDLIIPPSVGELSEGALAGLSPGMPGGGIVSTFTLQNLGLSASQQKNVVDLAQIVIPRGQYVSFSGLISTSNDGGSPIPIQSMVVPEPATIAMAGLGAFGLVAIASCRSLCCKLSSD